MKFIKNIMELREIDLTKVKEINISGIKYDIIKKRGSYTFTLIYQGECEHYDLLLTDNYIMFRKSGQFVWSKH